MKEALEIKKEGNDHFRKQGVIVSHMTLMLMSGSQTSFFV